MHLIFVVSDIDEESGGLPRACVQLADSLADESIELSLLFQDSDRQKLALDSRVHMLPVPRLGLKSRIFGDAEALVPLRRTCESTPDTLIHLHGIWDPLTQLVARFAQNNQIPYIISPHGMLEPWSLSQKKLKKKLALMSYLRGDLRQAHAVHATADSEATNLARLGVESDIFVIPNGISLADVQLRSETRNEIRKVVFMSRIHPKKGIEMLIDAWGHLNRKDWECNIIGPGEADYVQSLKERASACGNSDNIRICDPLAEEKKWEAYVHADLFVLPTYSENFGLVVAEAMAAGLPVITTTGTPWTNLNELGCGWCVEPALEPITEALSNAFSLSDEKLREMGEVGRRYVFATFDWKQIAENFIDHYGRVLARDA